MTETVIPAKQRAGHFIYSQPQHPAVTRSASQPHRGLFQLCQHSPPQSSHLWGAGHCRGQARGSRTQQPSRGASGAPVASQLRAKASLFLPFPRAKWENPAPSLSHLRVRYPAAGHKASPDEYHRVPSSLGHRHGRLPPAQLTLSWWVPSRGTAPFAPHSCGGKREVREAAASRSAGTPRHTPTTARHGHARHRTYSAARPAACLATGNR